MSLAWVTVRGRRVGAITELMVLLSRTVDRTTLPIDPEAPVRSTFMLNEFALIVILLYA